jgi:ferrochelatase
MLQSHSNTAVILLAHGTPDVLGEMAEYLAKVTGGRALPQEVVEELQHRYGQIGLGETPGAEAPPLTRWTLTQAHLLEQALAAAGTPLRVYAGMRNWHPYIADVVAEMRADGVTRVVAICLAPQNSRTSIGLYRRALMAAVEGDAERPMEVIFVESWSDEPALVEAFAQRLEVSWPEACADAGASLPVLFTAHSVPCRTIMTGEASIAGARPGTPIQAWSIAVSRRSFRGCRRGTSPSRARAWRAARGSGLRSRTPLRRSRRRGTRAWCCNRSASSATTSRSCTTSTSRSPRRRVGWDCGCTVRSR